ncbi:hypothetical protein [Paraburkholderia atlantica]|uniref:hypothetical protein n=1 Tax=Paraburkholderia atlantica TaxID=2654982 RepID=UPI0001BF5181|nr:hypothetical protein [Paraburkholderia atlantica]MBB5508231.1 hypothetical protein [Paraburkholderia atlantica]
MGHFSTEQLDDYAATFERDGMVVLRQHFPKATLLGWRDAFAPLLQQQIAAQATAVRGENRHYVTAVHGGLRRSVDLL